MRDVPGAYRFIFEIASDSHALVAEDQRSSPAFALRP